MFWRRKKHRAELAEAGDHGGRRLYWWNMPVRPERSDEAGGRMLASVGVWFASLVAIVVLIGVFFG